jgi:hypothetical protein
MMADVACFCGCFYSFDGGAGACPKCGEYATVTAGPALVSTGCGQQGEPVPAMNGHGHNGQTAATSWEWPEDDPGSLTGIAINMITPEPRTTGQEGRNSQSPRS